MQNKACKTAPGCYPYELFPFCRPLQSGAAWIPQNMPRLSSPKPFCGTILGKKVRFNISVISLTVPVISYRLGLSSLLFSRKKVPSVCSERTIHFRYVIVSITVLFLRAWTVPWWRFPYKQRKHTVSGLHATKCQAQPVPKLRSALLFCQNAFVPLYPASGSCCAWDWVKKWSLRTPAILPAAMPAMSCKTQPVYKPEPAAPDWNQDNRKSCCLSDIHQYSCEEP